jgi:hypothetical protein
MSKKTKIMIGVLVLMVACGALYSLVTTDTEADCLREWVYCSYKGHLSGCPGDGDNAWHRFRCNLCVGYSCPPAPDHHCVDLGWSCMMIPIEPVPSEPDLRAGRRIVRPEHPSCRTCGK